MNKSLITKARRRLLRMHFEANVGHLGGNLSCLEILMTLYHDVMKPEDLFILSKGHSAGSLYTVLWSKGILTDKQLKTFHGEDTHLPGHVHGELHESVPFATGSLGHGVSLGCGLALAKKLRKESGRVYVLTSDGEWNEGSCWEGLMFAVRHQLEITIIVDNNRLQGFGTTKNVSGLDNFRLKFWSFGIGSMESWSEHPDTLDIALKWIDRIGEPRAVICNTIKGHGVSFLENRMESHYDPMSKEQYEQAMRENPE